MELEQLRSPHRRTVRALLLDATETLLWIFAAVSLGFVVGVKSDAFLYQKFANIPMPALEISETVQIVAEGEPVARLSIPRLDVDVVVAEGSADDVLRRAVGRLETSARPGDNGNIVLAGHRDTFFRPLEHILEGDRIVLESAAGARTYVVEWTKVVDPTAVEVLEDSGQPELTLVTCYPFRYVGSAPFRFVVRARSHES
jgi:LPXTG-site transpeptidase (sortase) family protein